MMNRHSFAISLAVALLLTAGMGWLLLRPSLEDGSTNAQASLPHIPPNPPPVADEDWPLALETLVKTFPDGRRVAFERPSPSGAETGEALANVHCSVCHQKPTPDLLPKIGWIDLFLMKRRFFPAINMLDIEPQPLERFLVEQTATLGRENMWTRNRPRQAISNGQFFRMLEYYVHEAHVQSLPQVDKPASSAEAAPFEPRQLTELRQAGHEGFSLVAFEGDRLLLGTSREPSILIVDPATGQPLQRRRLPGIPVHATMQDEDLFVTMIGEDFGGVDRATGSLVRLTNVSETRIESVDTLLENLYRPIRIHFADLDGDGLQRDVIVLQFGLLYGAVDWYRYTPTGTLEFRERLIDAAGVVGVHMDDINGNGRSDILVLMSQADQSLYLFHNLGDGRLQKERVFQELPVFGFNSLTVADINGNGHLDVITTNGDNGDLLMSTPLRNYHGVRVFLNDGKGGFHPAFFYPMYGAIQVVAEDFTGNGHMDLAAISFFPDAQAARPETFVFLENQGEYTSVRQLPSPVFEPKHVAQTATKPWIAMAAGDLEGRGTMDIVLTSLELNPAAPTVARPSPNVMVLSNTSLSQPR